MQPNLARERKILSRLFVEFSVSGRTGPTGPRRPLDFVVAAAVVLGQLEGRPLTSHKIAQMLHLSRATVIRSLRVMVHEGLACPVDAHRFEMCALFFRQRDAIVQGQIKAVTRAARELDALGYNGVAKTPQSG